jgi:4-amino-4-deoxy-L-arabinose transferase-like glycosyltransferase
MKMRLSIVDRNLISLRRTFLLRWAQYEKKVLFALFLFALLARLSVNFWILGIDHVGGPDVRGYESIAQSLLTGRGFLSSSQDYAHRPPVYPLFLTLIYGTFGLRNYLALKLAESVIGALTCLVIYLIGKQVWGWPVGLAGAVIAALYPCFLYYTGAVLTENLFTFLLTAATYFLLRAEQYLLTAPWRGKSVYYLMGGFLLGLGILTRSYIVLLVPLLFLWAILVYPTLRSALIAVGLVVGVTVLTILPWTVRNFLVLQEFVPLSTVGGITFWGGNNPVVGQVPDRMGRWIHYSQLPGAQELDSLPEVEKDRLAYQMGLNFLRENPHLWGPLYLAKLKRFWSIVPNVDSRRDKLLSLLSYGLIFPFFWIGVVAAATYQRKPWLLWFVILVAVLNALIFYGSLRFRFPIEPFMILFAVLGFLRFIQTVDAACWHRLLTEATR